MDSSAKTIEEQVDSYKNKVDEMDTSVVSVQQIRLSSEKRKPQNSIGTYAVKTKPVQKKTLTDSVLDTIAKIIG